jgi:hypothetical protein
VGKTRLLIVIGAALLLDCARTEFAWRCLSDAECDDTLFCNGAETCIGGYCVHAGNPCASGSVCANDCNEAVDNCNATPATPCPDDANAMHRRRLRWRRCLRAPAHRSEHALP